MLMEYTFALFDKAQYNVSDRHYSAALILDLFFFRKLIPFYI